MKSRTTIFGLAILLLASLTLMKAENADGDHFRPPAVPLVTYDPYFSIWSFADHLTDDSTRHWTGKPQTLTSLIRIDGKAYRIMGVTPQGVPALSQRSLSVMPTSTTYEFEGAGVRVTLKFLTPLLPWDLEIYARPLTYLTWQVRSLDSQEHNLSLYFDNAAELVVNIPIEPVVWSREALGDMSVLRLGTKEQPILGTKGDDVRIDWGYLYVAVPSGQEAHAVATSTARAQKGFATSGAIPTKDDSHMPRAANDELPGIAVAFNIGRVTSQPVSRHLLLAYDDIYSIEYLHQRLRPYWRRDGAQIEDLLANADRDYAELEAKCRDFDEALFSDLRRVGGEKYAMIAALAYRQSLAAQKLVAGPHGEPFFFPKENSSNGCIGTVDVIYPEAPLLLLLNPKLVEATLEPVLDYAQSGRWHFPFAPHDLGTYPLANGQVYGGGERTERDQMPVEESGNLLLLVTAIAHIDGNANFAAKYWTLLTQWAEYLKSKGLDPANQLCTDDFAGHLAHNANLSVKAILALECYAGLCRMLGKQQDADLYSKTAEGFASQWMKMADDGDHYRLAFNKPGTWSQKYNLVWDKVLGLKLFPPAVTDREIAFYLKRLSRFGLPLDDRKDYTKLDWELWTAALADSQSDFDTLVSPVYFWVRETPSRVPLTDLYSTVTGKQAGPQARSVVGGVYMKVLRDDSTWRKWADRRQK